MTKPTIEEFNRSIKRIFNKILDATNGEDALESLNAMLLACQCNYQVILNSSSKEQMDNTELFIKDVLKMQEDIICKMIKMKKAEYE